MDDTDGEEGQSDICRVCRSGATKDNALFYPCLCTGSIKYVHQDCLVQWLKYSQREFCELCHHKFRFTPIYDMDMPKSLPVKDLVFGLLCSFGRALRFWLHSTFVALAWLGVVPLTACRIYRSLLTGSVSSVLYLPLDLLSTQNLLTDCLQGCFVVTCSLCAFIALVWLREQLMQGGGPEWLEEERNPPRRREGEGNEVQNAMVIPAAPRPLALLGMVGLPDPEVQPMHAEDEEEESDEGDEEDDEEDDAQPQQGGNNWNVMDFDRAADELTWERLLGFDGSLVFLEHVLWVVSLNAFFIIIFAFCPYHIGHFTVIGLQIQSTLQMMHYDGLLTSLVGYVVIALSLVLLYSATEFVKLGRVQRVLGNCYIVIKVSLLILCEVIFFPLVCGWWLDVCSLTVFDVTLADRRANFGRMPGTSLFLHWLVGLLYVFYFATFILLLREVLRPGVLWFLRNLNDPDFNPVHEMIHLPVYRHARRYLASLVVFGSTVLLVLWAPVHLIKMLWPTFLPYNVQLSSDAPVSELSLELLLLQVILPAVLEQGQARLWLKHLLRLWCRVVAAALGLHSYLIGNSEKEENENAADPEPANEGGEQAPNVEEPNPAEEPRNPAAAEPEENIAEVLEAPEVEVVNVAADPAPPAAAGLADAMPGGVAQVHQLMMQAGVPLADQDYVRPTYFGLRLLLLLGAVAVSLYCASVVCLTFPVWIGRLLLKMWLGDYRVHELYTASAGLYTSWIAVRAILLLQQWLPRGSRAILNQISIWALQGMKLAVASTLVLGAIPLLVGLIFDVVFISPVKIPLHQTPIASPVANWALGVLHVKIMCAITCMGPQWWLKTALERIYADGVRQLNLTYVITELCVPLISILGLILAVPYVVAHSLVPCFVSDEDLLVAVQRLIYPCLCVLIAAVGFFINQTQHLATVVHNIRDDKYLVGKQLVNYERPAIQAAA